jgi:hypothetical protein
VCKSSARPSAKGKNAPALIGETPGLIAGWLRNGGGRLHPAMQSNARTLKARTRRTPSPNTAPYCEQKIGGSCGLGRPWPAPMFILNREIRPPPRSGPVSNATGFNIFSGRQPIYPSRAAARSKTPSRGCQAGCVRAQRRRLRRLAPAPTFGGHLLSLLSGRFWQVWTPASIRRLQSIVVTQIPA